MSQQCDKPCPVLCEVVKRLSSVLWHFLSLKMHCLKTSDNICLEEEDVFQSNDKRGGAVLRADCETPPLLETGKIDENRTWKGTHHADKFGLRKPAE